MVASVLRRATEKYVHLHDLESALFYAERLIAEEPSDEADLLLARIYHRMGKVKQAYLILQNATHEENRYWLAVCSASLGLWKEAEQALLGGGASEESVPGGPAGLFLLGRVCRREHRRDSAVAYLRRALELDPFLWSAAVELNEMGADIDLAELHHTSTAASTRLLEERSAEAGDAPASAPPLTSQHQHSASPSERGTRSSVAPLGLSSVAMRMPLPSPGSVSPRRESVGGSSTHSGGGGGGGVGVPRGGLDFDSPGLTPIDGDGYDFTDTTMRTRTRSMRQVNRALVFGASTGRRSTGGQPATAASLTMSVSRDYEERAPPRGGRRVSFGPTARLSFSSLGALEGMNEDDEDEEEVDRMMMMEEEEELGLGNPTKLQRTLEEAGAVSVGGLWMGEGRGSTLLPPRSTSNAAASTVGTGGGGARSTISNTARYTAADESSRGGDRGPTDTETASSSLAVAGVRSLVVVFAAAHRQLCGNRADECIDSLRSLPLRHFRTAHVQQLLGQAYFAVSDYKACMSALREMLRLEPHRTRGLEILSTALWHLRRERDLAALAQQCVQVDKLCPEVWCVVGNCFSAQREHSTAVKFFERALQLDPSFVYAHTLSGHEHFANESYDKAIASFRQAVGLDERHFNAWYGLGVVFFRQERLDMAEYHFRRALALNPGSSVLCCYLGMVLHNAGDERRRAEALELLGGACAVDQSNPQLHFQLAHVYLSAVPARLEDALHQLQTVLELAPKEAPVHGLLGQVYLRLGRRGEAAYHFNSAVSLDAKEAAAMKTAYECYASEQEEEEVAE